MWAPHTGALGAEIGDNAHVWHGTLALMVLKIMVLKMLYMLEPRQGHGIGRRSSKPTATSTAKPSSVSSRAGIEQLKRERRKGAEHYDPDAVPRSG